MQQILSTSSANAEHHSMMESVLSNHLGGYLSQHSSKEVIKRDGSTAPLNIAKIRAVVDWACAGKKVNPIALEAGLTTRLRNGITTREIQDNLINCALEMCSPEEPDWRYVAGRLHIWNLWKDVLAARGYQYGDYATTVRTHLAENQYDERMGIYSSKELEEAGSWIHPDWDTDYDYAGAVLLTSRYLLPQELPQEALLTCALLLASAEKPENRLEWAKKFYQAIATRKVSLATPILANLRVPNGSLTSCFITAISDDLESIFSEISNTARISKNGGGVGVNVSRIRATGSWVMGKPNASGGVIPWIKILNDTAIAVNQGGRRAGAVTISVDVWHLDVPEFLEMQTENGDQRRKAYDIFPQLVLTDEFMRRVENKEDWTLVDPYEVKSKLGIDLAPLWGKEFEAAYTQIENSLGQQITLYKRVNARELFKHILRSQLETGMPYLAFKDTINQANPNKHLGMIPAVNLCVAGETKILTDQGQIPIMNLVGKQVNIWNGSEWSEVLIKKTGENQPLLKVHFSNGEYLECTYYHKFHIQKDYKGKIEIVDAKDLQPGDKLIKYHLPVVESEKDIEYPDAYTMGFFCGEGSHDGLGKPEIDLYGVKKELLPLLNVRNKYHGGISPIKGTQWRIEREEIAVYDDFKQDRIVCKLPLETPDKFTVPLNGYTVKSRLEWLAGLLDADGTVARNGSNESLQIASVNGQFLRDIRLMLQTLGVDTKITPMEDAGYQTLPDGKGGYKEYFCQAKYRLLISSVGLFQLGQLGLKTYRLQWTLRQPQREASHFIQVREIELTCRWDDTYCFNEPLRHLGMFNGILTGQCTESFSNVTPGETAHCCLAAGTKVLTEQGWKPIEQCDEVNVLVPFKSDKDFTPIYHFEKAQLIDNGIRDVYQLTLKNGRTIEATADHQFLVRQGSQKKQRKWVQLEEIQLGDRLEIQVPEYPLPEFYQASRNMTDAAIGWLIGDGWILNGSVGVCFGQKELNAQEIVIQEMTKIHGNNQSHSHASNTSVPKLQTNKLTGVKSWATGKQSFYEYLVSEYGLTIAKGGNKKLGDVIKSFPADRLASILSGLFSADGCVHNPSNSQNYPVIQLSSASLELLNDVRDCLSCFGIPSTVAFYYISQRGRSQGNLNISGWAVERFMEVIGFDLCPDKTEKYYQAYKPRKTEKPTFRRTSEVVKIEYVGQTQVYDLYVQNGHHFIAQGIVVHNCNLVSLNLANLESKDIPEVCQISVRLLDNTIELTHPPFEAAKRHNNLYRTIGVGCMGLADWLAKRHLSYEHLREISHLFEDIGYWCTHSSMELAKERGAYKAFDGSEWSRGKLIGAKPVEWFVERAYDVQRWVQLSEDIQRYGIRNSHITAIAPNTSSSLVQGCTASVLPVYSRFFYDKWAKGAVPIAPPFIEEGYWFYPENKVYDQKKVVKAIAVMQQWIDTGISMELLFNLNQGVYFPEEPDRCIKAKDIYETIIMAWQEGCKAIYYIRTVQKDDFKEGENNCSACAN